jgi:hypothetical protein
MGCAAALPQTIDEMERELKESAQRVVPTLIEIRTGSALTKALGE